MKKLELKKLAVLFCVGYPIYQSIEVTWKALIGGNGWGLIASSSIHMGLLGGFLFILLGLINEVPVVKNVPYFVQCIIGSIIVTIFEFITGYILNVIFGFGIWSYLNLKYDLLAQISFGQISFTYMFFWLLLSPLAFWMDDVLRYVFYKIGYCMKKRVIYSLGKVYKKLFTLQ